MIWWGVLPICNCSNTFNRFDSITLQRPLILKSQSDLCWVKNQSTSKGAVWKSKVWRARPKKWPDGEMWKRERPPKGPRQGQGQGQGVPWGWCEGSCSCQIHCRPMENPSRKVGLKSPFSFFVDICIFSSESIISVLFTPEFILLLKIWFETNLSQNCRVLYPILSHPVRPKSS